ncbi:FAM72 protein-domain-containing protein [Lactifluus subvellereus]|nr:FAM72 protein-domain-containing protein [Lactifluus subvellereus]KAI0256159.1 FAM72 protein-domain-containing protein [Lactifluus subvellereus]
MPSTTPPNLPHNATSANSSRYATATPQVGAISTHSWGRHRFHQPAAIYDTIPGVQYQVHAPTEHPFPPSIVALPGPAQQAILSASQYLSPMSQHPNWVYPNYTQWHPTSSSADAHAAATPATATTSSALRIAHKVWLLECKNCRTFLTNRGMKAVLLLRPHVPLYSTDALPVNCSAYSARPNSPLRQLSERQPRTCECLTQTLCCHGCGTSVGYMIVVPCARCTSSSSATNRVTNGHRFVFHSSELITSERHYTPGEPGILPAYTESSPSTPNPTSSPRSFLPDTPDLAGMHTSPTTSPTLTSSYSTMPPLIPESPCPVPSHVLSDQHKPNAQPLRAGDPLYWHHLVQSGEIPGATDDRRARGMSPISYDR